MANDVKLIITADDKTKAAVQSASSNLKYLEGGITKISIQFSAMAIAAQKAWGVVNKGYEILEHGAKEMQVEAAFKNVAKNYGENADEIVEAMKKASAGTIEDSALMQKAIKGMTQDLSGKDMIKIAEIARVTARTNGMSVAEAFDAVADAIANKMPKALNNLGLVSKAEAKILTSAIEHEVEGVNLLDLAFMQATRSGHALGGMAKDTTEDLQFMKAKLHEWYDWASQLAAKGFVYVVKHDTKTWADYNAEKLGLQSDPKAFEQSKSADQRKKEYLAKVAADDKIKEAKIAAARELENEIKTAHKKAKDEALEFDTLRNYDKEGSQHEKMIQTMAASDTMFNKMEMDHRQSEMDELKKTDAFREASQQNEHAFALQLNNELTDEDISNTEERLNSYRAMYNDMEGQQGKYYSFMLESLEEQRRMHEAHTHNKAAADAWYVAQKKKLDENLILSEGTVWEGMKLGMDKWVEEANKVGKSGFEVMQKALNGLADTLTDFVTTGKASFKSLTDSIVRDLIRMETQALMTSAIGNKGSGGTSSGWLGTAVSMVGSWFTAASAKGNVFDMGRLQPFAYGGIVDRPTIFPMARGTGLMGESGPEAVMPLKRGADGKLGVAGGSGGGDTYIIINAVDSKSFDDMCKRNPESITGRVTQSLRDNKTRTEFKRLLN